MTIYGYHGKSLSNHHLGTYCSQYSFGRLSASNIYQRMDDWYLVTCIRLDRNINQMCANAKSINILQVYKCIIQYILILLDASAPNNSRKWMLEHLIVHNSLLNMWQFWCLFRDHEKTAHFLEDQINANIYGNLSYFPLAVQCLVWLLSNEQNPVYRGLYYPVMWGCNKPWNKDPC